MKCKKCGAKMVIMNLPDETHYETRKRKLWVCPSCDNEVEIISGGKCR